MVCSEIAFAGGSCRVETSQLICSVNYLTGFCMLRVSNERYFRMDYCFFQLIRATVLKASIVICPTTISVLEYMHFTFYVFFTCGWSSLVVSDRFMV